MNDELKDFFKATIQEAKTIESDRASAEEYLQQYSESFGASLSDYTGLHVEVTARTNALSNFSAMAQRVGKNFMLHGLPNVQTTYTATNISFGIAGEPQIGQIGEYKPDPTSYFPVHICYGTKELCCSNRDEVEEGLKTMAQDSMGHILKALDRIKVSADTKN